MGPAPRLAWPRLAGAGTLLLLALGCCLALQPSVTPLFKLVEADDKPGLRALLPAEAARIGQTYQGRAPLHLAALTNHLQQARDLLAAGAGLEAADAQGRRPLHLAALARRLVMTQALLDLGADPRAADDQGFTPLHLAAWVGASPQLWRALVGAGADPQAQDRQGRTPMEILERLYPSLAAQARADRS